MPLTARFHALSSGDNTFAESGPGTLLLVPAKRMMARYHAVPLVQSQTRSATASGFWHCRRKTSLPEKQPHLSTGLHRKL
jgi:hypothetical protein